MRIGNNPLKDSNKPLEHTFHRIIIPVYIPNFEGYFEGSFKNLKCCIESIKKTTDETTKISLINNACTPVVTEYLNDLNSSGEVDQVIHNNANRGKIESVLSVARGSFEELITITDCDILFLNNWLSKTIQAFEDVSTLGAFSLLTVPHNVLNCNHSTILSSFLRAKIRPQAVLTPDQIDEIYNSIGLLGSESHKVALRNRQLVVNFGKNQYCLGCNHAVATYKKHVFLEKNKLNHKVKFAFNHSYKAVKKFIDLPTDENGFFRLSPTSPMAIHMGNVFEPEFQEIVDGLEVPRRLPETTKRVFARRMSLIRLLPYPLVRFFSIFIIRKVFGFK